jgi:hypothetical protein
VQPPCLGRTSNARRESKPVINTVFHPEAQGEYQAAFAWYEAHSQQAAVLFEAEVERVIQLVESSPEGFPKYDDLHRYALLRRFPFDSARHSRVDHSACNHPPGRSKWVRVPASGIARPACRPSWPHEIE